ncbi:hypothetical protein ACFY71_37425 [Streptomyces cinerochromogenes]|uniref:hypothetical protein n=1 Tax=Streptomyces cinerochromogenes TaxID=66422 RepID=UPI00369DCFD7
MVSRCGAVCASRRSPLTSRGRTTTDPTEIGSTTRVCFVVNAKVEIRVHVKPAGGAWSNWTGAATSQCQT